MNKNEHILGIIESSEFEVINSYIMERASIWMICGFINEANNLLELYWDIDDTVYPNSFYDVGGFQIFWKISDSYPSNVPYELQAIEEIVQENWSRHFWPHWKENSFYQNRIKNIPVEGYQGIDLMDHSIGLAYNEESPNKIASKKLQMESLNGIKKYINSENPVGHNLMKSLICAAIIAAKNNLDSEAKEIIKIWKDNLDKYNSNTSFSWIMRDISLARILKEGFLRKEFDLTKRECDEQINIIKKNLEQRFLSGVKFHFEHLSWNKLLNQLLTFATKSEYYETLEEIDLLNLNIKPATNEIIQINEDRLGITLPEDYKKFIQTSNGFPSYSSTTPTLLPIHQIDLLKKLCPDLVEIYFEVYNEFDKEKAQNFSNCILIGGLNEEQKLLLVPDKNYVNWECWFFANWNPGETIYRNFRFYIESELLELKDE